MPLIIDPGLYQNTKSDIFWVAPRRTLPTAFKLFTGMILTVKICIVLAFLNMFADVYASQMQTET